jgi:hypothetical protein
LSTALSIRLTKKLATLATCGGIAAALRRIFPAGEIGLGDLR